MKYVMFNVISIDMLLSFEPDITKASLALTSKDMLGVTSKYRHPKLFHI